MPSLKCIVVEPHTYVHLFLWPMDLRTLSTWWSVKSGITPDYFDQCGWQNSWLYRWQLVREQVVFSSTLSPHAANTVRCWQLFKWIYCCIVTPHRSKNWPSTDLYLSPPLITRSHKCPLWPSSLFMKVKNFINSTFFIGRVKFEAVSFRHFATKISNIPPALLQRLFHPWGNARACEWGDTGDISANLKGAFLCRNYSQEKYLMKYAF